MRRWLLRAHRWVGLLLAGFVTMAGLTGSIAAFHDAIDAQLNPDLFDARVPGATLAPATLVRRLQAQAPHAQLGYMLFHPPDGQSVRAYVQPRTDPATSHPFALAANELFLDPATGDLLGGRNSDACCFSRRALIPFLYRFHYTIGLGTPGQWIMGLLSAIWSVDCVVGLLLTLPPIRRRGVPRRAVEWLRGWRRGWRIETARRGFRLMFDLHRAVALWLWLVLLGIAISGFAIALDGPLFHPLVTSLLPVAQPATPPDAGTAHPEPDTDAIVALADEVMHKQGWHGDAGGVFVMPDAHLASVFFFRSAAERGTGLGRPTVTINTQTGRVAQMEMPGSGRAGDLVMQIQFPWHSGQILGFTGRVLVAFAGLATAGLAVTGVMIWERKRRARRRRSP
ncbi:MAG: PepSY-associated TM helix domain-containing protein [Janthinobacterium lividum]